MVVAQGFAVKLFVMQKKFIEFLEKTHKDGVKHSRVVKITILWEKDGFFYNNYIMN